MNKILRFPLRPYTRAHFGELKIDHDLALNDSGEFAHSDTLFSALVHSYAKSPNEVDTENFINYFKNNDIKISSLFYYLKNNEKHIYFLPKPVSLGLSDSKEGGRHKDRNRIAYVSVGVWKDGFVNVDFLSDRYVILQKKFVITQDEYKALALTDTDCEKLQIVTKVSNPKSPQRGPEGSGIYYQTDIQIAGKPNYKGTGATDDFEIGWYFLYQAEGQAETDLRKAAAIMAYTGIGGEISHTGRTPDRAPEADTLELDMGETNEHCSLSLINPSEAEFENITHYRTTLRGGRRLDDNRNTLLVRMIREGAVFSNNKVHGKLVNLSGLGEDTSRRDANGNIIWRNGKAFLLPCKMPQT